MNDQPNVTQFMADLLTRQTAIIQKALADLSALREALPPDRVSELDGTIAKLEAAIEDDRQALELLIAGRSKSDST